MPDAVDVSEAVSRSRPTSGRARADRLRCEPLEHVCSCGVGLCLVSLRWCYTVCMSIGRGEHHTRVQLRTVCAARTRRRTLCNPSPPSPAHGQMADSIYMFSGAVAGRCLISTPATDEYHRGQHNGADGPARRSAERGRCRPEGLGWEQSGLRGLRRRVKKSVIIMFVLFLIVHTGRHERTGART